MASIIARKRKDGTTGYTAMIVRKKDGKFLHREAKTFDRKAEATAWASFRETELNKPSGIKDAKRPSGTLGDAIDRYLLESEKTIGRTKAQVVRALKTSSLASMDCRDIGSEEIVAYARTLLKGGRKPQTVGNYISHLSAIFRVAKPAWGLALDREAMRDAQVVLRDLGTISKSHRRDRRPTLAEVDVLMQHFHDVNARRPASNPMHKVVAFALFSTRRMEEITRISWDDLEEANSRILVRDMKHPGQKVGNDIWCELPAEALRIIQAMPRTGSRIFPFSTDAIGMAFTRACQLLGINDLHFHDLRHEGVSRLFEMGRTIPQAASVSGHRSWQSLQRYAHLRADGDKFENWRWLDVIAPVAAPE